MLINYKKVVMLIVFFVTAFIAVFLSGCASTTETIPLKASVQTVAYLNPDESNLPSPIVVTFYQLKNSSAFKQANFFSLYNNASAVLGSALIDKEGMEIRPNQNRKIDLDLSTKARYIGVVAAYRNTSRARWRSIVTVPPNSKTIKLRVLLQSQGLELYPPKEGHVCISNSCLF